MTKISELYDQDFVLWTEEQAAALHQAKGANLPLDWENLAEEIESLGKSDRRTIKSRVRRILWHLFMLETSPQPKWHAAVLDARAEIEAVLGDSPSLRSQIDAAIHEQSAAAVQLAEDILGRCGESAQTVRARLEQGGFTAGQVLGDWFSDAPG
ncbi:MAG TPA: DUF29 domain-containing protein [Stellaceae bacterium]|jgi:hypothetical protein